MADTSPLLPADGSPGPEEEGGAGFPSDVIFFHGKELRSGMGMRQSFIRKPGTEQVLVRIGIGRDGVFKVDGVDNKVLEHWQFRDLKDWSFSGYSWTLKFQSGNRSYSVRTDDGEAICSYIEEFQKNPEQALKRARENPPNSKIPESGIRTLRRKFSGTDLNPPSASEQVKFYTMNRRTAKKSADPTSKLPHNIDVDSRLRAAYSQEILPHSGSDLGLALTKNGDSKKVNGLPEVGNQKSRFDRDPSSEKPDKPVSGGVRPGPTSTRGEATRNQATHPAKSSPTGTVSPMQPSSPLLQRRVAPELFVEPAPSLPQAPRKPNTLNPEDPEDYYVLRQRSVSETTNQRGSRPINVVKTYTMPWGSSLAGGEDMAAKEQAAQGGGGGGGGGGKSQALGAGDRRNSSPLAGKTTGKEKYRPGHLQHVLSNSSGALSSEVEFQSVLPKPYESQRSRESEGKEWYQGPTSPDEKPRPVSPPYDTLSRSDSDMSSDKFEFGGGIRSLRREDSSSFDDFRFNLTSPPSSPVYDHLPPSTFEEEERGGRRDKAASSSPPQSVKQDFLSSVVGGTDMRRNVSQPVFGTREGGGGRGGRGVSHSSSSPGPDSIKEETESDEDVSETNLDKSDVVRRPKRNGTQQKESDPFEDLLGTPQAVARLRWSQELNPLYDYIRGMKISESISSQDTGIKLYSTGSPVTPRGNAMVGSVGSSGKKMKKVPSVILEESESDTASVTSPKHGDMVPLITHSLPEGEEEREGEGEGEEGEGEGEWEEGTIPMIIPANKTSSLPRAPRKQHNYEDVFINIPRLSDKKTTSTAGLIAPPPILKKNKSATLAVSDTSSGGGGGVGGKLSLASLSNPAVRRLQTLNVAQERSGSVSPRLGKRQLQRRSRTIGCMDDTEAVTRKQRPLRAADTMKDFSYVMREYRLFYIKMPSGQMHSEVFSINRPLSELRDKLCDLLGVDNVDHYLLYVEGACLTSLKEGEVRGDSANQRGIWRSNSLTHILDHQWLPDQGTEPVLLKAALSFRMQGITTSRLLSLVCDDVVAEASTVYPSQLQLDDEAEEFHKHWISIVQGNTPCTTAQAVKLAAIQYQAYFLDRTAVHSVVGFCRPNEFLPTEFSMMRGLEQKMYKEQEKLKSMKTHREVHEAYVDKMAYLPTYDTVFFPVREPRKKMLQSTKLKPVILGVGPRGIMRVDPKTKEVLDTWDYQVLRNWAYSRKTFVLAFTDKNYPVESNQAKWMSMVVDFFVDSIITTAGTPTSTTPSKASRRKL